MSILFGSILELPRIQAAVALGEIDHIESKQALEEATRDTNYLVRYNAKSALRRLRTGVFDPIAQMIEEGWSVSYDQAGNTVLTRPGSNAESAPGVERGDSPDNTNSSGGPDKTKIKK
jgi:hypothetical protein